ncbi:TetR/AcrR family transcriptional regulator [Pedobacter aquatilis]|uniref:TetR/AcrR family transcriptional regulator n=1 Tax=Pedobacter aquatilis TaxID=351343 RepID=UPI00292E31DD|nr:TetR/AcrR family transcriptional regulator [Pedobacter aquatilis]
MSWIIYPNFFLVIATEICTLSDSDNFMGRKPTSGPIRDKDRTKTRLLQSVGSILEKDGFTGLSITNVAKIAAVDRKLIYEYYGTLDNLVKAYLNERDYWRINLAQVDQIVAMSKTDYGKQVAYELLENQFNSLLTNAEMRKIISWGLSEDVPALIALNKEREALAERLFTKLIDPYFIGKDKNIRAIHAILVSSIYYLTLSAKKKDSSMCGIDINQREGELEIKRTMKQIIDWAYS